MYCALCGNEQHRLEHGGWKACCIGEVSQINAPSLKYWGYWSSHAPFPADTWMRTPKTFRGLTLYTSRFWPSNKDARRPQI